MASAIPAIALSGTTKSASGLLVAVERIKLFKLAKVSASTVRTATPNWPMLLLKFSNMEIFDGFDGLNTTTTSAAFGNKLFKDSTIFGVISSFNDAIPVVLPPGLARLVMRPLPTGSLIIHITIGITDVS